MSGFARNEIENNGKGTTSIDWKSVGQILKDIRRVRRMSYRRLAELAGVHGGTVLRIEAGYPCRMDTVRKLERALNLTDGVLTHSAPLSSGSFYIQDRSHDFVHIRPNPTYTRRLPEYSQKMLNDPAERQRIGKLGLVSGFQWEADLGLEGSTMRSTMLELYHETAMNSHEGEEMVVGFRGVSRIKLGEDILVIHEGQSATFWPTIPHSYGPDPSTVPSILLSVRIDPPSKLKRS